MSLGPFLVQTWVEWTSYVTKSYPGPSREGTGRWGVVSSGPPRVRTTGGVDLSQGCVARGDRKEGPESEGRETGGLTVGPLGEYDTVAAVGPPDGGVGRVTRRHAGVVETGAPVGAPVHSRRRWRRSVSVPETKVWSRRRPTTLPQREGCVNGKSLGTGTSLRGFSTVGGFTSPRNKSPLVRVSRASVWTRVWTGWVLTSPARPTEGHEPRRVVMTTPVEPVPRLVPPVTVAFVPHTPPPPPNSSQKEGQSPWDPYTDGGTGIPLRTSTEPAPKSKGTE